MPFAYGRARVIHYQAPGGQVLSLSGAIRPPSHFPKATRTTHLHVEDVPATKVVIVFRSWWIVSGLAVDSWCVGRVALNIHKGQNPLKRTVHLGSYGTCSVGPSHAWTARQRTLHRKHTSQMLRCKGLGIQTTV